MSGCEPPTSQYVNQIYCDLLLCANALMASWKKSNYLPDLVIKTMCVFVWLHCKQIQQLLCFWQSSRGATLRFKRYPEMNITWISSTGLPCYSLFTDFSFYFGMYRPFKKLSISQFLISQRSSGSRNITDQQWLLTSTKAHRTHTKQGLRNKIKLFFLLWSVSPSLSGLQGNKAQCDPCDSEVVAQVCILLLTSPVLCVGMNGE